MGPAARGELSAVQTSHIQNTPSHTQHAADYVIADYTLQEYLNQNQDILSLNPQADVARICLTFLSFDDFSNKPPGDWYRRYCQPRIKDFPDNPYHFTFYASLSWGYHAQKAGETEEVIGAAIDFVSRPANVAYNWLVIKATLPSKGPWAGSSSPIAYEELLRDADLFRLLLPVHFGLEGLLVELLKRYTRPAEHALDKVISQLACHAARSGYKEIVRLLLTQKGVNWDIPDMTLENLLLLVDEDTLPTLLRKENCSVNVYYGSALQAAVAHTQVSRVRILLEAGADVGYLNTKHTCPVIISSPSPWKSWEEMMDLLLEYKVDINTDCRQCGTMLHLAARHPVLRSAVKYLVSKGANLNLPNGRGKTPLDIAEASAAEAAKAGTRKDRTRPGGYKTMRPYEMVIQILREAGGKTAKEMSQAFIGEQGPSFPPQWLERLKDKQGWGCGNDIDVGK